MDPSTEAICFGYRFEKGPTKLWHRGQKLPKDFLEATKDKSVIFCAHNAPFEQAITEYVLRAQFPEIPKLPPARWKCTSAKCAVAALPRALEAVALALRLKHQKDMAGHRQMLKYSKPRRAWIKWRDGGREGPEPEKYFNDPSELKQIYKYCITDVDVEFEIDNILPDLTETEQKIWILNQEMNQLGVAIDVETVELIIELMKKYSDKLTKELIRITKGAVTTANQRNKILDFLDECGVSMNSLSAASVKENLEAMNEEKKTKPARKIARRVLEIRSLLSKSSTKKYAALMARTSTDNRVRDIALYHGAHTGRDSGTGLQVHNLPRGLYDNTPEIVDYIREVKNLEDIELNYGNPLDVFSACVRPMITASAGHNLFAADFNAIEARVLAYLARDEGALKTFRLKKDAYVRMATVIFKIMADDVSAEQRQVGKIAELGLGYNMGWQKFLATCHQFGAAWVTAELAQMTVKLYRDLHHPIVKFWSLTERAAILATQKPGCVVKINGLRWQADKRALWCQLPWGRRIHYHAPSVRKEPTPWGEFRPKLYHWKVNSMTKKWECAPTYGGLLVENITQAVSRDVMFLAALRMKARGYRYLFSVHDEIVAEAKKGSVKEFEDILLQPIEWLPNIPLAAKGWTGFRYRK